MKTFPSLYYVVRFCLMRFVWVYNLEPLCWMPQTGIHLHTLVVSKRIWPQPFLVNIQMEPKGGLQNKKIATCNAKGQRLRWSRGSMLPVSTQACEFKPGQCCQDFSGQKNPQHAFLQRGSKAVDPMLQICGILKIPKWNVEVDRQNHRPTFSPTVPPIAARNSCRMDVEAPGGGSGNI
jgi:hypothetical protein